MRLGAYLIVGVVSAAVAGCDTPEGTAVPGSEPAPATTGSSPDGTVPALPGSAPAVDPGALNRPLPKVQDRDPEEEKRKMSLSRQRSTQARKFLEQRRYDEAVLQARQALKIHELNADAMLVLAEVFYQKGNYELTQTVAASVLGIDPKVLPPEEASRAHNLRGFALVQMGLPLAATNSFRQAAEADPNNAPAWNNLGTRYLAGGDVKTAIEVFKYAVELKPRFYKAQMNLGAAYRAARRWQEAEQAFRKALQLKPAYPEAYFNLGVLYLDADPYPGLDTVARLNKAIGYLTKYRELAIAHPPAGPAKRPAAVGRKEAPETVSPNRANAYIAVAKKGLEREARRADRDKKRKERESEKKSRAAHGAAAPSAPTPTPQPAPQPSPTSPTSPADGSKPPGPAAGEKPRPNRPAPPPAGPQAPQKPAQKPSAPAPQKPGPQTPRPAPPPAAPSPQKPSVQRPGGGTP